MNIFYEKRDENLIIICIYSERVYFYEFIFENNLENIKMESTNLALNILLNIKKKYIASVGEKYYFEFH